MDNGLWWKADLRRPIHPSLSDTAKHMLLRVIRDVVGEEATDEQIQRIILAIDSFSCVVTDMIDSLEKRNLDLIMNSTRPIIMEIPRDPHRS